MEITAGYDVSVYYSRNRLHDITLLFLCKHESQSVAYDTLCKIGNHLQSKLTYPIKGDGFGWVKSDANDPQFVTRLSSGQFIYSCVIDITAQF